MTTEHRVSPGSPPGRVLHAAPGFEMWLKNVEIVAAFYVGLRFRRV
jgi:hypothetical protein